MARWDNVIIAPQPHVKFTAKDLEELGRPFQYTKNLVLACDPLGIDDTTGKNDAESELAGDDEKVNEEKKGGDSKIGSLRLLPDSESSTSPILATRAGRRAHNFSSSDSSSESSSSSQSSSSSDSSVNASVDSHFPSQ